MYFFGTPNSKNLFLGRQPGGSLQAERLQGMVRDAAAVAKAREAPVVESEFGLELFVNFRILNKS